METAPGYLEVSRKYFTLGSARVVGGGDGLGEPPERRQPQRQSCGRVVASKIVGHDHHQSEEVWLTHHKHLNISLPLPPPESLGSTTRPESKHLNGKQLLVTD